MNKDESSNNKKVEWHPKAKKPKANKPSRKMVQSGKDVKKDQLDDGDLN